MNVEQEIKVIHDRNRRVELDKEWERSWTRRMSISIVTYVIAGFWLYIIGNEHFLLNAAVPTGGYIFSTLTLPLLKRTWIKKG